MRVRRLVRTETERKLSKFLVTRCGDWGHGIAYFIYFEISLSLSLIQQQIHTTGHLFAIVGERAKAEPQEVLVRFIPSSILHFESASRVNTKDH